MKILNVVLKLLKLKEKNNCIIVIIIEKRHFFISEYEYYFIEFFSLFNILNKI